MTSGRKFQYLHFFGLLSLLISCLWCATLLCRCSARRNADFRFLDTNSLILIGFWYALPWYFLRFSGWEKYKRNVTFVYTHMRTSHPCPFCVPQHQQKVTVLCGILCHLLVCFSTLRVRLDSNDAFHPPDLLQLCEFPLLRHFQDIPFTRVYLHPLARHLHDVAVFLFSFQSGWSLRLLLCTHFLASNHSHLTLSMCCLCQTDQRQWELERIWSGQNAREREAKAHIHDKSYTHTRIPALYLHDCMPAFWHASPTTHFILLDCILAVVPCCFPVDSPVSLPWLFVNMLPSTGRVPPVQAKTTAGALSVVRMQSVLMLPGCCHSCTPIAHTAPVLMFFNSNNMKRKYEMCPKFTLTYINLSTIYVHESISALEPCICAQEKHSVNIHPNARRHI